MRHSEPESRIVRKREGQGAGRRDREQTRAAERMTERWSTRQDRDRKQNREVQQ